MITSAFIQSGTTGRPQTHRLATGGLIDRSRQLNFTFDGRSYSGHPGDTLAAALLANGVRLVGRSFKYHRPRGILSAGSEEPNALIELRTGGRREPNTRATIVELYDGLIARSQNRWPSLAFDISAINQLAGPLIAAGFYYKTFKWPASFWEKIYEPLIRRAAGLGRVPTARDPDRYEKATIYCDVLVIGSGPAGLAAALAAARAGARVVLCEEDFTLGGRLFAERQDFLDESAADWVGRVERELRDNPDVRIFLKTSVFGVYDHGAYGAIERVNDHLPEPPEFQPRHRMWRIIAKQAVLASGAIERPLLFGDNDRPGVMLAGSVRAYINRFGVAPGKRAVVVTNNHDAWRTITDLANAGIDVRAVVDTRECPPPGQEKLAEQVGARVIKGGVPMRAVGRSSVEAAEISTRDGLVRIDCDLIAMSGGWSPNLHLSCHLGSRPGWDERLAAFVPVDPPPGLEIAGAAAGSFTSSETLRTGANAGLAAARSCGYEGRCPELPSCEEEIFSAAPAWKIPEASRKIFVDFQNDVTLSDLDLARREGFRAIEHVKRYTTLGMGTDQGKTANTNAAATMAERVSQSVGQTGTITFRPPYVPVCIGALAGHHRGKQFRSTRLTPTHAWASEQGAVFVEAGLWLRAQYFPRDGEDWLASCAREATAVRSSVGVCDVSTLGKIDVQGADAGTFLERVYANTISTLPIGRARYGIMLREDGFVFDDGTVARMAETEFVLTTTTSNAAAAMAHMEYCVQCLWPELDVTLSSVTEHWAQIALAGPRARQVLRKVVDSDFDVSNSAFAYMAARKMTVLGGIPCRLYRLSFSGELGFEIAVPARWGDGLIRSLMDAGREYGITPYGLEAMSVMRIEKGHVAAGELNGRTTARDLRLDKMISKNKDFIGRMMSGRPALVDPDRPTLAGFRPVDPAHRLTAGAHFITNGARASAANDEGYMTSVAYSPNAKCWIGLGLIRGGASNGGKHFRAVDLLSGTDVPVEVNSCCFFDARGERLRA